MSNTTIQFRPLRSSYERLMALWICRFATIEKCRNHFFEKLKSNTQALPIFLGLSTKKLEAPDFRENLLRALEVLRSKLEKARFVGIPSVIASNFTIFSNALHLNHTEQRVLEFLILSIRESILEDILECVRKNDNHEGNQINHLAVILGLKSSALKQALSLNGCLRRCGLITKSIGPDKEISINFFSTKIAYRMMFEKCTIKNMLENFGLQIPAAAELTISDYPHLEKELQLLLPYLKSALAMKKKGVNILLHGPPGTGKTQLTRVLGESLHTEVFEFSPTDKDGAPHQPADRLAATRICMALRGNNSSFFVFDEAEDILQQSISRRLRNDDNKAWLNQLLETNVHPVCWISNSIHSLDTAYARRFDFIIEVPMPPKKQRAAIIGRCTNQMASPNLVERLSQHDCIAPALVSRAHHVMKAIHCNAGQDYDDGIIQIMNGVLKAQSHSSLDGPLSTPLPKDVYDIQYLNTEINFREMADLLKQRRNARICLYGPPGTGKTAFGHWLANELGLPLQIERASDLLGPYVGMTEAQIATAFKNAKQSDSILLIDEIDSFLQNRAKSQRSWEVTQINEMLTQIECFQGILIGSTNLIDHLDPASLRRFDLKVHFDYMRPEQIRSLLSAYCLKLALPLPSSQILKFTDQMEHTTPGDFAAVARRHAFQPFRDAGDLLDAVLSEAELKTRQSRSIGFH